MRRALGWIAIGLLVGIAAVGCGPNVSQSDLGTVVFEVPAVAGAEEPYKFPELAPLPPGSAPPRRGMPLVVPNMPPPPEKE